MIAVGCIHLEIAEIASTRSWAATAKAGGMVRQGRRHRPSVEVQLSWAGRRLLGQLSTAFSLCGLRCYQLAEMQQV
jgi:hypothetical protein